MVRCLLGCIYLFEVCFFSEYRPRSGTAGSYGISSSSLSFSRNFHAIFRMGCSNLHSRQQCTRGSSPPHPLQRLLFVDFLMMAILTSVRRYFTVVLIYIALIISNVEHLLCAFGRHLHALGECLPKYSVGFLAGVLVSDASLSEQLVYSGDEHTSGCFV